MNLGKHKSKNHIPLKQSMPYIIEKKDISIKVFIQSNIVPTKWFRGALI